MRLRPGEFVVALITAATVVIVGVEQGIILAIVLSVIVVLAHVYKPHDRVISFAADGSRVFGPVDAAGRGRARAGDLRVRRGAVLCEREPLHRGDREHPRGRSSRRSSGSRSMRLPSRTLTTQVPTHFARCTRRSPSMAHGSCCAAVDTPVRKLLDAYGLTDLIGPASIFQSVADVVAAYRSDHADSAETGETLRADLRPDRRCLAGSRGSAAQPAPARAQRVEGKHRAGGKRP